MSPWIAKGEVFKEKEDEGEEFEGKGIIERASIFLQREGMSSREEGEEEGEEEGGVGVLVRVLIFLQVETIALR